MKKLSKILLATIAALGLAFSVGTVNSASAATVTYGTWKSVPSFGSSCKVRVVRDANYYTSTAGTIDIKIENNGSCSGTMYYQTFLRDHATSGRMSGYQSGYFTYASPWKKFSQTSLTYSGNPTYANVHVNFYKNSSHTISGGRIDAGFSSGFAIYKP